MDSPMLPHFPDMTLGILGRRQEVVLVTYPTKQAPNKRNAEKWLLYCWPLLTFWALNRTINGQIAAGLGMT